jgi:hypothetical protein
MSYKQTKITKNEGLNVVNEFLNVILLFKNEFLNVLVEMQF